VYFTDTDENACLKQSIGMYEKAEYFGTTVKACF